MHLLDSYIKTLAFLMRTALKALNRLGNAQADLGLFCLQTVNNTLLVSLNAAHFSTCTLLGLTLRIVLI